ncbi:hypothetical protein DL96DRAFT_1619290 [Flagelloscypha sp. PMI_526]|nr:hypothetical protein DL96DRAFT_1619290 [Flagelloscypha sp. PMI_526]
MFEPDSIPLSPRIESGMDDRPAQLYRTSLPPFPIHRLPQELFEEILLDACSINDQIDPFKLMAARVHRFQRTILAVSHVNVHWRVTATNLPELWSTIVINAATFSPRQHYLLPLWLQRSQNAPLNVFMAMKIVWPRVAFFPRLSILIDQSPRWSRLTLYGTGTGGLVEAIVKNRHSVVESLYLPKLVSLNVFGYGLEEDVFLFSACLRDAPALRHFAVMPELHPQNWNPEFRRILTVKAKSLAWPSLTSFQLDKSTSLHPTDLHSIFRNCPQIFYLEAKVTPVDEFSSPVLLTCLQMHSLVLETTRLGVLENIRFPALKLLHLTGVESPDADRIPDIIQFGCQGVSSLCLNDIFPTFVASLVMPLPPPLTMISLCFPRRIPQSGRQRQVIPFALAVDAIASLFNSTLQLFLTIYLTFEGLISQLQLPSSFPALETINVTLHVDRLLGVNRVHREMQGLDANGWKLQVVPLQDD